MTSLERKLELALNEIERLEKGVIHNYSSPKDKIAVFRSLFRGRPLHSDDLSVLGSRYHSL